MVRIRRKEFLPPPICKAQPPPDGVTTTITGFGILSFIQADGQPYHQLQVSFTPTVPGVPMGSMLQILVPSGWTANPGTCQNLIPVNTALHAPATARYGWIQLKLGNETWSCTTFKLPY